MTKTEFMYVVGIADADTLERALRVENDVEPKDGDWTGLMRKWYFRMVESRNHYEEMYHFFSRPTDYEF